MSILQDDGGHAEQALQAAYDEAVRVAYRTLAIAVTDYFDENRDIYKNESFTVPENFRPLRDYEKALKIQKLVLRLALKTAASAEYGMAIDGGGLPSCGNDYRSSPAVQKLPG
jgi:hypothetical protein